MTDRHYDVVVLGRSLGALACAALLARRDFRVLVLGQGARPPSYRVEGHTVRRGAFSMVAATSPAFHRVLTELAATQSFQRRATSLDPMFTVFLPGRTLEVPPDLELFTREIDREMPEVRRVVDELYAELARVNAAVDAVFERDLVWPPGTFFERQAARRASAALPHSLADSFADPFADFPERHPYRSIGDALVRFASDLASSGRTRMPTIAAMRLHGAWTRGMLALADGEDDVAELLLERVRGHGGDVRIDERATRIAVRSGAAAGVVVEGDTSPIGATWVVSDGTGEDVAALSGGEGVTKRAEREWPRLVPTVGRFVVSCVVRDAGLPAPFGREGFVLAGDDDRGRSRPLAVHVVRHAARDDAGAATGDSLLVAEALFPLGQGRGAATAVVADGRERVLAALARAFPFVDRHLVVVDSPHDGRPAWIYEGGARRELDRVHLKGASLRAEPMQVQWSFDRPGASPLEGEPVRGPVERTFLVGSSVVPSLGQEGRLLAAWSAARIVTRADPQKERMRRAMWSKFEIG